MENIVIGIEGYVGTGIQGNYIWYIKNRINKC